MFVERGRRLTSCIGYARLTFNHARPQLALAIRTITTPNEEIHPNKGPTPTFIQAYILT